MGYDCTLHLIDPERIRTVFCARALGRPAPATPFDAQEGSRRDWEALARALAGGDAAEAAQLVAAVAVRFSAAESAAHYERGFCLSLWAERMEDDALLANVPKKHRGSHADLDALFAPLVDAHPRLKGKWPLDLTGNYSVGVYVPPDKVPELLKWARKKTAGYRKPDRRVFRGLLLVLEECRRRGLAYWEASDLAAVAHPIEVPQDQRAAWLEEAPMPLPGAWQLTADVALPGRPPLCVFDFLGRNDFRNDPPACAVADLSGWPPEWVTRDEALRPCDLGRDGRWLVVSRREADVTSQSAPRKLELRDALGADGAAIEFPPLEWVRKILRWQSHPDAPGQGATPGVAYVALIDGTPVVLVNTSGLPPTFGGPRDTASPPRRPLAWRNGTLAEVDELPESAGRDNWLRVVRLADGGEVLLWLGRGYELRDGSLRATFTLCPDGWDLWHDNVGSSGDDAFLAQAYSQADRGGALFLSRRGGPPRRAAPALADLAKFAPGPAGGVLARQHGPRPQHLGCILWPEQGAGGTVAWIDDDLFADEDPDDIDQLLWSPTARRLIAVTTKRLWAAPADRVMNSPRYDATTGRKIRGA